VKRRLAGVLAAALLAPSMLGACGTDTRERATPVQQRETVAEAVAQIKAGADFDATDVMFLQMLVHHQEQGLEMTAVALERTGDPRVREFAQAVQAIEQDELTMMRSWLTEWHQPTTVDTAADLHASHGGLPATGPDEIKALHTVKAPSFDSAFLNLFLAHQHNALEMAHLETSNGTNPETLKFAERVRQSRQGEVQQMLRLMNP
jgi:uncharacterized protein (DUF305 family)